MKTSGISHASSDDWLQL